MSTNPIAPLPNEVFATYAGRIEQVSVASILRAIGTASANQVTHLHLLFQSFGGIIGDGVCLYNVFRVLPFGLTLYNAGAVESIGAVAYLGAKHRKVSTHATFMLHRTVNVSTRPASSAELKVSAQNIDVEDARVEAILREHLTLSDDEWRTMDHHDLILSAPRAVQVGLAHEVAEFAPPPDKQLFNI